MLPSFVIPLASFSSIKYDFKFSFSRNLAIKWRACSYTHLSFILSTSLCLYLFLLFLALFYSDSLTHDSLSNTLTTRRLVQMMAKQMYDTIAPQQVSKEQDRTCPNCGCSSTYPLDSNRKCCITVADPGTNKPTPDPSAMTDESMVFSNPPGWTDNADELVDLIDTGNESDLDMPDNEGEHDAQGDQDSQDGPKKPGHVEFLQDTAAMPLHSNVANTAQRLQSGQLSYGDVHVALEMVLRACKGTAMLAVEPFFFKELQSHGVEITAACKKFSDFADYQYAFFPFEHHGHWSVMIVCDYGRYSVGINSTGQANFDYSNLLNAYYAHLGQGWESTCWSDRQILEVNTADSAFFILSFCRRFLSAVGNAIAAVTERDPTFSWESEVREWRLELLRHQVRLVSFF